MLRNRLLPLPLTLPLQQAALNWQRSKSSTGSVNATRQSKILGKLFGSRVSGTKKRWYPSHDANSSGGTSSHATGYQPPSVVFQASQFGKSNSSGSKQNTRRIAVLNKLFMTHITDLLATGEAAESILGRGLQVTRVKITGDFSCVNVYWMGNDATLETELQRCSGQLRHELSQLRLMGEVPRIKFVRDRSGSNINQVEGILRTLNLQPVVEEDETAAQQQVDSPHYDVAQTARQEFYGQAAATTTTTTPEMRHDVLGLDHRLIMDKILGKMRKSKQAWEQHQSTTASSTPPPTSTELMRQIAVTETAASQHKFEAFLAKRRERKQTPERKKHQRVEEDYALAATTMSGQDYDERTMYEQQEDYIVDEDDKKS
ncbi:uncharacterized protein LOC133848570 [Drosophila sulfurigaster albostrigata]|uniref:uncharacterized protein LOC133848570 n=1 Tax=Drosophila sulfurigaster albostrigata TaxID=89887 RepID=UPI002D21A495|nr:uncharacterized protein LOC133848570 [Drosophila sulfurigaster albostrigata]